MSVRRKGPKDSHVYTEAFVRSGPEIPRFEATRKGSFRLEVPQGLQKIGYFLKTFRAFLEFAEIY